MVPTCGSSSGALGELRAFQAIGTCTRSFETSEFFIAQALRSGGQTNRMRYAYAKRFSPMAIDRGDGPAAAVADGCSHSVDAGTPPRRRPRPRAASALSGLEPGFSPRHDEVGLLRDAGGDAGAGGLRRCGGLLAATATRARRSARWSSRRAGSAAGVGARARPPSGRPAAPQLLEQPRFSGSWNHSWTLRAISGPIPATASICVLARTPRARRSSRTRRARTCATCAPTWRMLSATSSRQSGRSFDASIAPAGSRSTCP